MIGTWAAAVPLIVAADVCVIGSGAAGSTAAIAAARGGASVVLVEKLPFLGGTSTAVLDTFYGYWTPGQAPRKVVAGIADEVVAGLRALGPVIERPNTYGAGTGLTYLAEHLKVAWEQLVTDAGVRILLHTTLQDVARDDHRRVTTVLVATKAGLRRIVSEAFVDASGDADLCAFAGFGFETAGEIDPAQTLTTTFRMANVDRERRRSIGREELHALMARAAADGYGLPRREGSDHVTPIDGVTATIMTRLEPNALRTDGSLVNTTDPDFLTSAEIDGRRQALEYARFLVDRVPGYERSSLVALGTQIGIRETRRVHGDARLTRDDVLTAR